MKKRILGLVMALCLIVSLLPLTALAADTAPEATFSYIAKGKYNETPTVVTMNAGDAAKYFTTKKGIDPDRANNYYLVADGTADNYNVKLDYPAGGVFTIYLKGATLNNDFGIRFGTKTGDTYSTGDVKVVVEADSALTHNNIDAYRYASLAFWTTGDATITGSGKLTVTASRYKDFGYIEAFGNLTFKDANIFMPDPEQGYYWGNAVYVNGGDLTIDGGTFLADYETYVTNVRQRRCVMNVLKAIKNAAGEGGNITIKNGAKVTIYDGGQSYTRSIVADGTITIDKSEVEVLMTNWWREDHKVFNKAPVIVADGYEVVVMKNDAETGENWCGDMNFDEDDDTIIYMPIKKDVEATLENGGLTKYADCSADDMVDLVAFRMKHVCVDADADKDCTTAEVCDKCGETIVEAKTHAGEDDGDCTTAVVCTNEGCEHVITEAKEAHTYTDDKDASCDNAGC